MAQAGPQSKEVASVNLGLGLVLSSACLKCAFVHFVLFGHLYFCTNFLLLSLSQVIFEDVKKFL